MKRRMPIYGKAVVVFVVALFVFLVVVPLASAPIPGQLFGWYIVTTLVAILLPTYPQQRHPGKNFQALRRLLLARTCCDETAASCGFHCPAAGHRMVFSTWASGSAEPPGGLR
jgi:hypothetical protein